MEARLQQTFSSGIGFESSRGLPRRNNRRGILDHRYSAVRHHNNIINRYSIINQCLQVIKESDIGTVEKLKIETMLIRAKILLLDEVPAPPAESCVSGDRAFEALLAEVRKIGCGHTREATVASLTEALVNLLATLGGSANAGADPR